MKCTLCQQEKDNLICQDCINGLKTDTSFESDKKEILEQINGIIKSFEILIKVPSSFRKARQVEIEILSNLKKLREKVS